VILSSENSYVLRHIINISLLSENLVLTAESISGSLLFISKFYTSTETFYVVNKTKRSFFRCKNFILHTILHTLIIM
jgi:hypothetical protein